MERRRRLHEEQREHLQDVVLDDVAHRPGRLVEPAAVADAERFGDGDLHVVDPGAVPDRLEDGVREPQSEQVLHCLLGQVVVDPEDLLLREGRGQVGVQVAGAVFVPAERLLDHRTDEAVAGRLAEPGLSQTQGDRTEQPRGSGEVVDPVTARTGGGVALVEDVGQPLVGGRVVVPAGDVPRRGRHVGPPRIAGAGLVFAAVAPKPVVAHRCPCDTNQGDALWQRPVGGETFQGRQELARGEVA
jgi:hypothetical protein